jgi:hypothetical protein
MGKEKIINDSGVENNQDIQTKEELTLELEDIRKKEDELLNKINREFDRAKLEKRKTYFEVMHLSFNDFSQIVIGCCVFGLPAFINTSFWDYLPEVDTLLLVYIHFFFLSCVIVALNYEFRDNFSFNSWFFKMLLKRFFYTYFSVLMVILFLLVLVNKVNYSLTNLEVFRNYLAAQSVGVFGAVTFSFLKK